MENSEICSNCGGACCIAHPGMAFPEDILRLAPGAGMTDALLAAFERGYVVDSWEGKCCPEQEVFTAYYVRPKCHTDNHIRNATWGGVCCFLGPKGCRLEFAARPRVCRELQPRKSHNPGQNCVAGAGKQEACIAWLPYNQEIQVAMERQGDLFEPFTLYPDLYSASAQRHLREWRRAW